MALIPAASFARTSGVAPLAVFCDASDTTDASTVKPYHELNYIGDVLQNGSRVDWGNYAYGTLQSKSIGRGPEQMLVFRDAGTFTYRLTVENETDETASITQTITVEDPDVVFAGDKTIVVNPVGDADFSAAPDPDNNVLVNSDEFDTTLATYIATGPIRVLFKKTCTFTATTRVDVDVAGPGIIGSYGPSGKATVEFGNHTLLDGRNLATDWRIMDLILDGQDNVSAIGFAGGGSFSQFTLLGVEFRNVKFGVQLDVNTLDLLNDAGTTTVSGTEASGQDVITVASAANMVVGQAISIALAGGRDDHVSVIENISGTDITIETALPANSVNNGTVQFWALPHNPSHPLWDQLCIAECVVDTLVGDANSGANGFFFAGSRVGLLGNLSDPQLQGEHGFRAMRLDRAAVVSNTAQNVTAGDEDGVGAKVCFSMRSLNFGGSPTLAAGSYSEKMVFRGNRPIGGGSAGGCGPNNDTTTGRWRNVIIEGNWYQSEANSPDRVTIASVTLATIRNNVFDLSGQTSGDGARSIVLRNDITHGLTPNNIDIYRNSFYRSDAGAVVYRPIVIQTGITDSVVVQDNMAYGPNTTGPVMVTETGTASVTDTNNSTQAQITGTLPYTDATPTDPTAGEFAPNGAHGAGTTVPVYDDFNGSIRVSVDMGALGGTVQSVDDWLESIYGEDSSPGLVDEGAPGRGSQQRRRRYIMPDGSMVQATTDEAYEILQRFSAPAVKPKAVRAEKKIVMPRIALEKRDVRFLPAEDAQADTWKVVLSERFTYRPDPKANLLACERLNRIKDDEEAISLLI